MIHEAFRSGWCLQRNFPGIDLAKLHHFNAVGAVCDHPARQLKVAEGAVVVPVSAEGCLPEAIRGDFADRHWLPPPLADRARTQQHFEFALPPREWCSVPDGNLWRLQQRACRGGRRGFFGRARRCAGQRR